MSNLYVDNIKPSSSWNSNELASNNIPDYVSTYTGMSANKASAKAWCFWGQTSDDHDADTSFNVSSVTDSGAGHSTINFATAMPTVNYVVATSYNLQGSYTGSLQVTTKATGSCQLKAWYGTGGGAADATDCNAVFYSN